MSFEISNNFFSIFHSQGHMNQFLIRGSTTSVSQIVSLGKSKATGLGFNKKVKEEAP